MGWGGATRSTCRHPEDESTQAVEIYRLADVFQSGFLATTPLEARHVNCCNLAGVSV